MLMSRIRPALHPRVRQQTHWRKCMLPVAHGRKDAKLFGFAQQACFLYVGECEATLLQSRQESGLLKLGQ